MTNTGCVYPKSPVLLKNLIGFQNGQCSMYDRSVLIFCLMMVLWSPGCGRSERASVQQAEKPVAADFEGKVRCLIEGKTIAASGWVGSANAPFEFELEIPGSLREKSRSSIAMICAKTEEGSDLLIGSCTLEDDEGERGLVRLRGRIGPPRRVGKCFLEGRLPTGEVLFSMPIKFE